MKRIALGLITLVGLTGCADQQYDDPTSNYIAPQISNSVDQLIASEGAQAVASQRTLSMVERTRTPPTVVPNPNDGAPPALLTKITELNWSGPVGGLIEALADKVGYQYIRPEVNLQVPDAMVNLCLLYTSPSPRDRG